MRKRNRLIGGLVVLGAIGFAACFGGELTESTTAQQVLVPSQNPSSCGTTMVGTPIGCPPITITSDNTLDDFTITGVTSNCPAFAIAPDPTPTRIFCDTTAQAFAGATYGTCVPSAYTINAMFTPTGGGPASCLVSIYYTTTGGGSGASNVMTVSFDGTGQAATYAMSATPTTTIHFTGIPVNTPSSAVPITVQNDGTGSLSVTGTNSNTAQFTVTPSPITATLPTTGSTADYTVSCTPPAAGTLYAGTLTFTSSPGGIVRTVNYDCTGISTMVLISPNPASFGSTTVGRPPPDVTVTITNNNATAINLTKVALDPSGLNADLSIVSGGVSSPTPLAAAGGTRQVVLRYAATTRFPAGELGRLLVNDGTGDRAISVSGAALEGKLGASPAMVEFGPVCVGATASQPITVAAEAGAGFNLTSITQPSAPFSATGTLGPLLGNRANTITVTAAVAPTAPADDLTGVVTLRSDLPIEPDLAISVHAIALPAGVAPTPDTVHFGANRIAMTTVAKKVTLSNCGTTAVNLTSASITGPNANEFVIVSPENPAMALAQMGKTEFLVVMSPSTSGVKTAQLVIAYDGGSATVALDGTAFGGDDGTGDGKGTYYSCSVGTGGGGALPLALAVLVLRRRRRRA